MSTLLEPVQVYSKALAEIDVLCKFAEIAYRYGYCRPQILDAGREVTVVKGRHPVVKRCLSEKCFVPNSTYLGYTNENKGSSNPTVFSLEHAETSNEVCDGNADDEDWTSNGKRSEGFWPRPDVMVLTGPNASGKSY
ncbi:hypothetical protein R1flu_013582 [Riccia fluitans]|uniref:Uncharacterized protein n=1 Tax=Riccia fluitans TaxID=41844 RepID=A0ABD1YDZ4_9MARC